MATKTKPAAKRTASTKAKTTTAKTTTKKAADKVEDTMTQAADKAKEFTKMTNEKMEDFMADAQTRAKDAAEKAMSLAGETVEFHKANIEAMVESGKITAKGMQDLGKQNAEFARENFEAMTSSMQNMTSVKNPRDYFEMQNEKGRAAFDTLVSQASKNTETFMKLASDAFQPLSARMTAAMENVRKAA